MAVVSKEDAEGQGQAPAWNVDQANGSACVRFSGSWTRAQGLPNFGQLEAELGAASTGRSVRADTSAVNDWDSILLVFLFRLRRWCAEHEVDFDRASLPTDLAEILALAEAVPEKRDARQRTEAGSWVTQLGQFTIDFYHGTVAGLTFVGEIILSLGRLFTGKARLRWKDFWLVMQDVGVNALPIVALISFLVGLIISFLGAVVLRQFAAEVYVSYLVGYGMLREMGAIMAGIIMAGRTGAAFAAQIGSMKVSEEIDALKTLGLSPIDFIVLPRVLSLSLMMPLLTVFANVVGILGGLFVASAMLEIPSVQFFSSMADAVGPSDLVLGIVKGSVFGVLIAISGCLRGMQSGNSADAVGMAATSAVVTGITLIILFNAILDYLAVIFNV